MRLRIAGLIVAVFAASVLAQSVEVPARGGGTITVVAAAAAPVKPVEEPSPAQAAQAAHAADIEQPTETAASPTAIPASIPSDFSRDALLDKGGGIPGSGAPDVVGAFRFMCSPGHVSYDDPIVYPGQSRQSHAHQFFGNTETDAFSTYDSLRRKGRSTCMNELNRSAYWIPAMMNGAGMVVRPDYISIYYKRLPASSPECQVRGKACVDLPRGLRYVFGYDMIKSQKAPWSGYFNCDGNGAQPGHYPTITEAASHCPVGARLGAIIDAPSCWDGVHLDTPDHRSHLGYPDYGGWGYLKCPASHPYVIPSFTLGAWYAVDEQLDRSGKWDGSSHSWHFSSDEMPGLDGRMREPGSTFHADWFGAWDDATLLTWTRNCIDKLLNCSTGQLGNGEQMKSDGPFVWVASPHLAALPVRPENGHH